MKTMTLLLASGFLLPTQAFSSEFCGRQYQICLEHFVPEEKCAEGKRKCEEARMDESSARKDQSKDKQDSSSTKDKPERR
ncbi:MAG TPA: hypothetical protein PKO07_19915 [Pseudomonadota bacterium]|nr:hypothetical protein [Pseudomonadota bacterium]HNF96343.1 hypothetical protein [Pseudomonadota bacterium]HNN53308.1 hypothetical protein [Pseudomonadota bacterium]